MQEDQVQRRGEITFIVLILGVAVLVWREAAKLPPAPYDPLGPASFPRWASIGLGVLGMAMIVRLLRGKALGRAAQSLVSGLGGEIEHARKPWIALLTLLLAFAYAGLLGLRAVPFQLATTAYLFAGGLILGPLDRRRGLGLAAFAVLAGFALDLLFRRIFSLDLS
jgi:hypothetical protein